MDGWIIDFFKAREIINVLTQAILCELNQDIITHGWGQKMTLCESELCQSQSIRLCVLMEHTRWEGRMEITNTRVSWVNGCMVAHRLTPVWTTWVCIHKEDNVLCCRMGHVGLTREWHAPFIPDYWRQVWNYPNILVFLFLKEGTPWTCRKKVLSPSHEHGSNYTTLH